MTYTSKPTTIKTIRQDESGFYISDGYRIAGRAGIEISPECPAEYRRMIQVAMANKWVTFVAQIHDHELMWEQLAQ